MNRVIDRYRMAKTPLCKDTQKTRRCHGGGVRKFAIKLFDRDEGEAANWPLIADTPFKAAFDALDKSPDDASRALLLRRVHTGAYDRLAAVCDPASSKTPAPAGRNEAAKTDLQSPGPGAADAFRNSV
jgi:DNA-directed RNA polymerase specialized sigma24 family protein